MKRLIIFLLAMMLVLTFTGCKKSGNDNDNNKKPNTPVQPVDPPKPSKLISKVGSSNTIEDAMKKFNEKYDDWNAFRMYHNDKESNCEYGVWDDDDIYTGNFEKYAERGYMPAAYFIVYYPEGSVEGDIEGLRYWAPYENIDDVDEDKAEGLVYWQTLLFKALFPDLADKDIEKIISKLALMDEEGFEAYRKGQADPSEFTATNVEVYPSENGEPYTLTCEYDKEYNTYMVTFAK